MRVAINGFGRIGKLVARALFSHKMGQNLELAVINDTSNLATATHLFNFDSVHGTIEPQASFDEGRQQMLIGEKKVAYVNTRKMEDLHWKDWGVDLVLECTGAFTKNAVLHKEMGGAKFVIVSAPAENVDETIVVGVNEGKITQQSTVISAGSCTTNALAPLIKVIHENFGIHTANMTTIHAMTGDQTLVDHHHKDLRRARSGNLSMIPTSTGAAKAIGLIFPQLLGKIMGAAVRVPTNNVSLVDLVASVERPPKDKKEVLETIQRQLDQDASLASVLRICHKPLVSIDHNHTSHSSIIDAMETNINQEFLRILAWYDNEWAFSCRMVELAELIRRAQQ